MDKSHSFAREIPEYASVDIVVVGGGPSGVGAAISAARCGKNVILCEQSAQLGGMGTLGNVAVFMWTGNFTGIYKEIMMSLNPGKRIINERGRPSIPQYDPFRMRIHLNEKCDDEGVKVMYHTQFVGVLKEPEESSKITGVVVNTREGLRVITARQIIDCTGDARVATDAGSEYTSGRPEDGLTQPMTLMFAMQDTGKPVERSLPAGCPEYNSVDELPQGRLLYWQMTGTGTLLVNMTRVKAHGSKIDDINMVEREALKQVYGVVDYLQRTEFPNHILSHIAPQTGVRQTRQVVGEYTLTEQDLMQSCKFDDVVAQTNYEIDIHDPTGAGNCDERRLGLYDIPYRCMVPKGLNNVLVSGRAISASHVAMSSLRVMATCYALGQAAGIASSLAIDSNCTVKDIPIVALHDRLKRQGVEFA